MKLSAGARLPSAQQYRPGANASCHKILRNKESSIDLVKDFASIDRGKLFSYTWQENINFLLLVLCLLVMDSRSDILETAFP